MRHVTTLLNIAASDGNPGTAVDVRCLRELTVAITGGGAFSFKVQGKISPSAAPTVVPAGNPGVVAAPTTAKPAVDVPSVTTNDDWVDLTGAIVANSILAIANAAGAPLAVTHVRIYRTTGDNAQRAIVAGRDTRTV